MTRDIEVSVSSRGDVTAITVAGDVTASTGASIEKAYHDATAGKASKFLLLFDGENYINSGGIAILIGIAAASRTKGQTIRITGLSPHFEKIFGMVGLTRYAEVFPTEEAALEGL